MSQENRVSRSFSGVVIKVLSLGQEGGAIFAIGTPTGRRIRIRADWHLLATKPAIGETWSVEGRFEKSVYGTQLKSEAAEVVKPDGRSIVPFLAYGAAFPEFDARAARALLARMGPALQYALESKNVTTLVATGKLSLTAALSLTNQWRAFWDLAELRGTLQRAGLSADLASLALRLWGSDVCHRIRTNPYVLVSLCSWSKIDGSAARHFDVKDRASIRLIGAAEAVCWENQLNGHTSIRYSDLVARVVLKVGAKLTPTALSLAFSSRRLILLKAPDGTTLAQAVGMYRIESAIRNALGETRDFNRSEPFRPIAPIKEQRQFPANKLRPITVVRACGWSCADILSFYKNRLGNSVHLIAQQLDTPSLSTASNCVQFNEVLRNATTLPSQTHAVVVHSAEGIDIPMFGKILRRIPVSARILLITRVPHQRACGTGDILSALMSAGLTLEVDLGPPPSAHQKQLRRALTRVESGQFPGNLCTRLDTAHSRGLYLVSCQTLRQILHETVARYYQLAAQGDVTIAILPRVLRQRLNNMLHEEVAMPRRTQSVEFAEARLAYGETAIADEPIVCNRPLLEIGIPRSSIGRLLQVYKRPTFRIRWGHVVSIRAEAELVVGGRVQLTAEELDCFSLAYALPVDRMHFCSPLHVIIPVIPSRNIDNHWIHSAMASASGTVTFIGASDLLQVCIGRASPQKAFLSGIAASVADDKTPWSVS